MSAAHHLFRIQEPVEPLTIPPPPKPVVRKAKPVVETIIRDHRQLDMWPAQAVRIARSWLGRGQQQ